MTPPKLLPIVNVASIANSVGDDFAVLNLPYFLLFSETQVKVETVYIGIARISVYLFFSSGGPKWRACSFMLSMILFVLGFLGP